MPEKEIHRVLDDLIEDMHGCAMKKKRKQLQKKCEHVPWKCLARLENAVRVGKMMSLPKQKKYMVR